MSVSTLVRYTVLPGLLGWGAFAAILLTSPNPDDISVARMLAGFAAWIAVSGAIGGAMFLIDLRRPATSASRFAVPFADKGPDCERCGKPTGKPFLYNNPRQHWRCEPCEREVTDIVFRAASEGHLTDTMMAAIRPYPEK